mgnify:CR=1 FL=1
MRIAICDDEDQERLNIKALVKRYAPELSIVLFSSADELLAAKTTFFPLIFLDIEMDDTNGFDAAEELMSGSAKPLIVFVTKSTEYTIRGYDVAFHYLVKPLNEAKFHEVLKRALRLIIPQYFTFSSNGELYRIPVQEILYFESRNYMLFVHTQQQIYKARLSLKEVEPQLSSANFLRIHASFLINLHHVIRITKDDIEMQDHHLIKISRNRKKDVIAAFTKFARENI